MSSRIYSSQDCDLSFLKSSKIAVIGFGFQGRAFALNLRDSGCNVTVLLRKGSLSLGIASSAGLNVAAISEIANYNVLILAIPDHQQPALFRAITGSLQSGRRTFVFLHGLNFHYKNVKICNDDDAILIAPHGPGNDLRSKYLSAEGLSCFIAIGQDRSGFAKQMALALAKGIGADRAGIYETTFADETIGDLFGEQTLLVGGLAGLTNIVFEMLVKKGLSSENAYLETIKQLKLLATMIEDHGPAGMIEKVSKTAAFGSLLAMPELFDESFKHKLEQLYSSIESGQFNKLLQKEAKSNFQNVRQKFEQLNNSASQQAHNDFKKNKKV